MNKYSFLIVLFLSNSAFGGWGDGWEAKISDSSCYMSAWYSSKNYEIKTPVDAVTLSFVVITRENDLPPALEHTGYSLGQTVFFTHIMEYTKGKDIPAKVKEVTVGGLKMSNAKMEDSGFYYLDPTHTAELRAKLNGKKPVSIDAIDEGGGKYHIPVEKKRIVIAEAMMLACANERTRNKAVKKGM